MSSGLSIILLPLSTLYGAVSRARNAAYRRGLLSVSKLNARVISVGNITTGGTGKTPLVEWVCRAIRDMKVSDHETKVCVLTRGYGRENSSAQVVVSDGVNVLASERQAGDEAFLLARDLIGAAAVISNADRVAAGRWAETHLGTEVFVLDDGFQHRRLSRDLDVVVIDSTNPWGGGRLLPLGRLREPLTSLSRANCVVITRAEQVDNLESIRQTIRRVATDVPVFVSRMVTSAARWLDNRDHEAVIRRSKCVAAFCGIGNPESFFEHLRRDGYELLLTRRFPDHHNYRQTEINQLIADAQSRGAESMVTTTKDATKLSSLEIKLPCLVLETKIEMDDEAGFIELIKKSLGGSLRV
jgi:tetraacyldisaccharide 4'-kinase